MMTFSVAPSLTSNDLPIYNCPPKNRHQAVPSKISLNSRLRLVAKIGCAVTMAIVAAVAGRDAYNNQRIEQVTQLVPKDCGRALEQVNALIYPSQNLLEVALEPIVKQCDFDWRQRENYPRTYFTQKRAYEKTRQKVLLDLFESQLTATAYVDAIATANKLRYNMDNHILSGTWEMANECLYRIIDSSSDLHIQKLAEEAFPTLEGRLQASIRISKKANARGN